MQSFFAIIEMGLEISSRNRRKKNWFECGEKWMRWHEGANYYLHSLKESVQCLFILMKFVTLKFALFKQMKNGMNFK